MKPNLQAMLAIARAVRDTKMSACKIDGLTQDEFSIQARHLHDQGLVVAEFQARQGRAAVAVVRRLTPLGEAFVSQG